MSVSSKFVLQQGPVIATLAGTAVEALRQRLGRTPTGPVVTPGPEVEATLPPRPRALIAAYVRHVGGDPSAYRGTVPPHMFPQWGFPLAARTLRGIPYPLVKVLNGGCRLEMNAPLPGDRELHVRARLESIDDDGRRAVLHQRVVTGTSDVPDAVVGHLYAIVPLGRPNGTSNQTAGTTNGSPRRDKPRVPAAARPGHPGVEEIARWRLRSDAGLDFAKLTGDFNPVHWIKPYARAFGFRSTILHGFSTMARAIEGLNRGLFAGSTRVLEVFDCKFTRPLVLPARVGLYVQGQQVYVGDAPGGPAYLTGIFTPTSEASS